MARYQVTRHSDGINECGDQVLIFQHLQNASHGFTRTADNLTDFLTGNFDLHTVRVSHSVWLFCQIQQSLCNAARHVEERQVAHFL